ncbi:MAG: recombinase family protein [Nanoarchaeota archaeon]|nr:recombinase family protein [Nanoarchaeota archaeon]
MDCEKCGHNSDSGREKFGSPLCTVCFHLAPEEKDSFSEYVGEKVDGSLLGTFRKHFNPGEKQKKGMIKKAIRGVTMSRAPFGYKIEKGELVPAENSREIEEIFEEFLDNKVSLRKIAEKHKLSVNGLKKILRNFTYIGKIKFNNEIYEGNHQEIISSTLFNHVQNQLEARKIK